MIQKQASVIVQVDGSHNFNCYPTGPHSAEYEVFIQYFSQIVNSLSVQTLSAHFVAQNIISHPDQLEILSIASPRKAASLLLSRISSAVEAGVNESFYRFLDIAEQYGGIDSKNVSLAIKQSLFYKAKGTKICIVFVWVHL